MAMTKKERLEFETKLEAAQTMAALRWTEKVRPDISPPESYSTVVDGWYPNGYDGRVEPACTSCISHSIGNHSKTTTQGARSIYSSKILALKAARNIVEKEAAKKLHMIDIRIALELENGGA